MIETTNFTMLRTAGLLLISSDIPIPEDADSVTGRLLGEDLHVDLAAGCVLKRVDKSLFVGATEVLLGQLSDAGEVLGSVEVVMLAA